MKYIDILADMDGLEGGLVLHHQEEMNGDLYTVSLMDLNLVKGEVEL